MLLFFLPDGQIVLHTGDFRADPSMETYPELLSCRVQTLYLDTTLVPISLLSYTLSSAYWKAKLREHGCVHGVDQCSLTRVQIFNASSLVFLATVALSTPSPDRRKSSVLQPAQHLNW